MKKILRPTDENAIRISFKKFVSRLSIMLAFVAFAMSANAQCNIGVSIISVTNPTCSGSTNGSATAAATGNAGLVTYSWSNAALGATISSLSVGTYTVTATDGAIAGCTATASVTLVAANPAASSAAVVSTNSPICSGNNAIYNISGGANEIITYTLTPGGSSTLTLDGSGSGTVTAVAPPIGSPGSTITLSSASTGVCSLAISSTNSVTVNALPPTPTFTALADLCTSEPIQLNQTGGSPVGGIYSGAGVTDGGNGTSYSFDPSGAGAGAGTHTITYTVTDPVTTCTNTATDNVVVFALPTITFSPLNGVCIDAGIQSALGVVTPTGGTFSGTAGVTDDANGTTFTFDPATAGIGTHTVTYVYTDPVTLCTDSASVNITVNGKPTITASQSPAPPAIICSGDALTLNGGGGTSYVWNNSVTDNTPFSIGASAIYAVTGTDANGCTNTATILVLVNQLPTAILSSVTDTVCAGGTIPAAPTSTTDGTGVSWSPALTEGAPLSVPTTQVYTVTSIDAAGCTNTATYNAVARALPTITTTNDTTCQYGTFTLTASPALTYNWSGPNSNSATGSSITVISAMPTDSGVYTVTGTDGFGCVNTATALGTVNAQPSYTAVATPNAICIGQGSTVLTGTPLPATYQYLNSVPYGTPISPTVTTTYYLEGTDLNGCKDTASVTVTVNPLPVISTVSDTTCDGQPFAVSVSSGFALYSWAGPNSNTSSTDTLSKAAAVLADAGTYSVLVTDANGCTSTSTATLTVNPLPVVSFTALNDLCLNVGVQSGLGGGTPTGGVYSGPGVTDGGNGTSYSFDPAAAGVGIHTITYTYTNNNGCVNTATDNVEVFPLPVVTFTAPADLCLNAGIQTGLGGGLPSGPGGVYSGPGVTDGGNGTTYSFNPVAAGVATHTITYTYTDGNGCIVSATDDITVKPLPVISFTATADICVDGGTQTGQGGATPSGGVYSGAGVTDNGNGLTYTFDPAAAGVGVHTLTYTYTDPITNCTDFRTDDVEVFGKPTVVANVSPTGTICTGDTIILFGTGASTYIWAQTGAPFTTPQDGVPFSIPTNRAYVVTGTDANGCTNTAGILVQVRVRPVVVLDKTTDSVCTGGTGTSPVILTPPSNGTSYSWDNGMVSPGTYVANSTTVYTVTAVDALGCTQTATFNAVARALPIVVGVSDTVCDGQTANLSATPTGLTYSWSGVQSGTGNPFSFTASTTDAGTYTVTATDAYGCVNSATATLVVNALPAVVITPSATAICSLQSASLTAGGATTYSWDNAPTNSTTASITESPSTTTTYTVTGTDGNGCVNTAASVVTVNPLPSVIASGTTVCIGSSATLISLGSATAPTTGSITYSWSGPVPSNINTDLNQNYNFVSTSVADSGTYVVTASDVNGCSATATAVLSLDSLPVMSVTPATTAICAGQSATLTAVGSVSSYSWDNAPTNSTSVSITESPANTTTYVVTGTDANGCSSTGFATVTVNQLPVLSVNNPTVCENDAFTVNVTPTGLVSYVWTAPNSNTSTTDNLPVASATTSDAGSYTIVATDANSCVNTVTATVTVNTLPTVSITPSYDSICAGASTTLTASGASTYAWDNAPTNSLTASITESPAATTSYTVTGTDGNSCVNTASVLVTVTPIPATPTATTVDPICAIGLGQINVTSPLSGPYAYSIDGSTYQGSPNFTPMSGTYNVTVRDTSNTACVSAPLSVTLNGTVVVCDPNIAVGASALPVAIPEGDSANVEYYISNVGNYPTNDTIFILISKPINGTLDVTIPAGWNVLLENPSAIVLEAPSVVILPGLLNRVTIPAKYIHNGTNEDALRIINIFAQPGSGGETQFNNNEGQTYIQIN